MWEEMLTALRAAGRVLKSTEIWSNFLQNKYVTRALNRFHQVDVMPIADIIEIENQTSNNTLNSLMTIYMAIIQIARSTHVCMCIHAPQTIAADLMLMCCDELKYSWS
jgi:hypothetical protein